MFFYYIHSVTDIVKSIAFEYKRVDIKDLERCEHHCGYGFYNYCPLCNVYIEPAKRCPHCESDF